MSRTLLPLALILLLPAALSASEKEPRKPSPFAPSLPQLTDEEEEAIDHIVGRFIAYDTGQLRGDEGKKALRDFQKLGPEAIFGLIRGLNRAALMDASCPAVTIGKKVASILRATKDPELLQYARENIGAGVTRTLHGGVLRDLRFLCLLRQRAVARTTSTVRRQKPVKTPRTMSITELSTAVTKAHGPQLRRYLSELAQRDGDEVINALGSAAATRDKEVGPLGRTYLVRHLSRLSASAIRPKLKDDRPAVRAAAAQAVGNKRYRLGGELIDLLSDTSPDVRQAARQALVKLSGGKDFGPKPDASDKQRAEALEKWRTWWAGQGK